MNGNAEEILEQAGSNKYSDQNCPNCGASLRWSTLHTAFTCPECGPVIEGDVNQ